MGRLFKLFLAHFRVNTRNRLAFFFAILFPLIFITIMGIAFQESDPVNTTLTIGLVNDDSGIPSSALVPGQDGQFLQGHDISSQFISLLEAITFEDNSTSIFEITSYNSISEAQEDLQRRTIKGLLHLPQDFSLAYMAGLRSSFNLSEVTNQWQGYPTADLQVSAELLGDPSLLDFTIVSTIMDEVISGYFSFGSSNPVELQVDRTTTDGHTTFDRVVPGLVVFALISNISTVAAVALGDVESGLLDRLRLSKMRNWEYTLALILSQQLMAILQIPIMFGAALLFGFPLSAKILLAYLFALILSLGMTGIGLMLAGMVSNASAVGGLSAIITTPMAFLAGAFFSMPNPTLIAAGGILGDRSFGVFDLLPPRMAIDALRLLLINDFSLGEVMYELVVVTILSLLYLVLGLLIYNRKHFRAK